MGTCLCGCGGMADTLSSGGSAFRRAGSTPANRTTKSIFSYNQKYHSAKDIATGNVFY